MALPKYASTEDRIWYYGARAFTGLVLCYLVLPILIIIPISFTAGNLLAFPMPGFSFRWYASLVDGSAWIDAARNSLIVGLSSTALSLALGTMAAIGLAKARFRLKPLVLAVLISPMVIPIVIVAVAVYFLFVSVGLVGTYAGLILAHTALASPFVVISMMAALDGYDANLSRAAASLGAHPLTVFRRITLPIVFPGFASGGLFAFATSFDEIVVALFISSPEQRTLPRQIFSGVREYVSPGIAAAATILVLLSASLLLLMELVRRRAQRLRSGISRA